MPTNMRTHTFFVNRPTHVGRQMLSNMRTKPPVTAFARTPNMGGGLHMLAKLIVAKPSANEIAMRPPRVTHGAPVMRPQSLRAGLFLKKTHWNHKNPSHRVRPL